MEENLLDKNINTLDISINILTLLENNNIVLIEQLCQNTKTSLRNIGLSMQEINQIEIALQLLGLDLANNTY